MKESEIRPKEIFDEYLSLAKRDIEKYFSDPGKPCLCPACNCEGIHAFKKNGFSYEECPSCLTLFVSPRPEADTFARYYKESESSKYWASTFYKVTANARREKIWKPKAKMIFDVLNEYGSNNHEVIDIGGGYGIFAEEYEKKSGKKVTIIEPGNALAEVCRNKGLKVIHGFLEDISPGDIRAKSRAFVSFELFEHLHNPGEFLNHLYNLMVPGDIFIFTTLSGAGVDIRALWEDSKSVSPPHHLNFLNPKSSQQLLERMGFKVLQTSTPGKLDIDILCNNKEFIKDNFWRAFVNQASEEEKKKMQKFIADNGWSSHMLIVSQKP